jgi:hypothetical protein
LDSRAVRIVPRWPATDFAASNLHSEPFSVTGDDVW